jgi:O-antigen/teichoic acid export membrane protein
MFVAKQQFWRNAVLETSAGALFLLLAAVLKLVDGNVVVWGLLVMVQFALVSLLGFTWLVRQYGWPSTSPHVALADLREGLYFASSTVMQVASTDFDKVLLARLSSLEATGVYSAAARIVQLAYLPLNAFLATVNSRFFQAGAQGSEYAIRFALRILPYTAVYGLIASLALHAMAPLLPLIFGPDFSSSTAAIRWLALIPLLQGLYFPFADALAGSNSIRLRTSAQAGALAVGVVLGFTLIPPLGWLGAAIAVLCSQFSLLVILVVMTLGRSRVERDRSQRQSNG